MIGKKYAQLRPRHRWRAHDPFLLKHASVFLRVGEGVIVMWTPGVLWRCSLSAHLSFVIVAAITATRLLSFRYVVKAKSRDKILYIRCTKMHAR